MLIGRVSGVSGGSHRSDMCSLCGRKADLHDCYCCGSNYCDDCTAAQDCRKCGLAACRQCVNDGVCEECRSRHAAAGQ